MDIRPIATIWDRDGSLASIHNGPSKLAPRGSKEDKEQWREFNCSLVFDAVVPNVAALLRAIKPGVVRIMVSGRMEGDKAGETFRKLQMWQWIRKNDLPIDLLFMRSAGDQRKDSAVKEEILVNKILPYFNPVVAVDDRDSVVAVWRKYGIYTIHVSNPGTLPPIAFQIPQT